MTNTNCLPTLSLSDLDTVAGGFDRNSAVNLGKNAGEIGTYAAGAAGGAWAGGPGGAALGTAAAEAAVRTGVPGQVGGWLGGKAYDGAAAIGRGATNAWNAGRQALGF